MESKLPWAAVLGNHDQESTMNREELMSFISLMDYSVSEVNPPDKNGNLMVNIDGFGNYYIGINGAPGSSFANTSVLNLYFLDSGDKAVVNGFRTYGWIKSSQLLWLHDLSRKLQVCRDWKCLKVWRLCSSLQESIYIYLDLIIKFEIDHHYNAG